MALARSLNMQYENLPIFGKIGKNREYWLMGGEVVMVTNEEMYKSWLANVAQDKVFWRHDGVVVKNLDELAAALREMSEETFRYHATGDKNDFSNWVRDVIGDGTLANQLHKAMTQATAARKVETRLGWLKARL
jgi:hypothetical protein